MAIFERAEAEAVNDMTPIYSGRLCRGYPENWIQALAQAMDGISSPEKDGLLFSSTLLIGSSHRFPQGMLM